MRLGDQIIIRTGAVISRLQPKKSNGTKEVYVLTLKAQTAEGRINHEAIETLNIDFDLKDDYFTKDGDVLVRLTYPYTATVIEEKDKGLMVSSHYAIIRCKESINPWYLFWWLKQNRDLLYKEASGSVLLGTISSNVIAELPIKVIPLDQQMKIAELIRILRRERELVIKLIELKSKLVNAVVKTIAL